MEEFNIKKSRLIQKVISSKMGKKEGKTLKINWIEALFLNEIRGEDKFFDTEFLKGKKLSPYIIYRDLRLRGLFPVFRELRGDATPLETYKGNKLRLKKVKIKEVVLSKEGYALIPSSLSWLYYDHWFGQLGVYKSKKGSLFLLDRFETYYLYKKGLLSLSEEEISNLSKTPNFFDYFEVYSSWRDNGFVVKSGFKFGADFRIYFPGVSPRKFEHSKHVLHVFPKGFNMKVEELSRAIRVANSVKKTFILAVPNSTARASLDFFVLDRDSSPRYAVKTFSQDDKISSKKLASLLRESSSLGLNLLFSIADRESAVTYYEIKEIKLPSPKFSFYEVKWVNP